MQRLGWMEVWELRALKITPSYVVCWGEWGERQKAARERIWLGGEMIGGVGRIE